MPVHDWTRVTAGTFHDFHNAWIIHLKEAFNTRILPRGYYAQSEQHAGLVIIDMPLFLEGAGYVTAPLESTYMAAFRGVPEKYRIVLTQPSA